MSVSVVLGDITLSHADAIVNAANRTLLGGCLLYTSDAADE